MRQSSKWEQPEFQFFHQVLRVLDLLIQGSYLGYTDANDNEKQQHPDGIFAVALNSDLAGLEGYCSSLGLNISRLVNEEDYARYLTIIR